MLDSLSPLHDIRMDKQSDSSVGMVFPDWYAVEFDVGGVVFRAHPQLLAIVSPVFNAMFLGDWKEGYQHRLFDIARGEYPTKDTTYGSLSPSLQPTTLSLPTHCMSKPHQTQKDKVPILHEEEKSNTESIIEKTESSNKNTLKITLHDVSARAFKVFLQFAYYRTDVISIISSDQNLAEEVVVLVDRFDVQLMRDIIWDYYETQPVCIRMRIAELWGDEAHFIAASKELLNTDQDITSLVGWNRLSLTVQISAITKAYQRKLKTLSYIKSCDIVDASYVWTSTPLHWAPSDGSFNAMSLRGASDSSKREILRTVKNWVTSVDSNLQDAENLHLSLYEC